MIQTTEIENQFNQRTSHCSSLILPDHEVVISGVKTRRGDSFVCSCGIYQGLFDRQKFGQKLVKDICRTYSIYDVRVQSFIEEVEQALFQYYSSTTNIIRLSVGKHLDSQGKGKYEKYLDINIEKIQSDRDKDILYNIIYFLLRYTFTSDLIETRSNDASKIWSLFPQPARGGELPPSIQTSVHR